MNKLEHILSGWNFRKITRIYIVLAVIAAIGCLSAAGFVYRERISFAWQYTRLKEKAEKTPPAGLQSEIDRLAASPDVIDILILDGSNQVTYSARNSVFGSGSLTLVRAGQGSDYLLSDKDASVVFKSVKSKEFMLSSVFSQDFGSVREEYDNTCFYESGFSDRTVCLLSYLSGQDGSAKIYIITSPTSVPGGSLTLRVDACIAMLFFMIYWVLLALWVFRNAARSRLSPLFWGLIVLLTNIAGLLVYQLYKHGNAACPSCGASQSKSHLYCVNCGEPMGAKCPRCGAHVSAGDRFCPHCGSKLA